MWRPEHISEWRLFLGSAYFSEREIMFNFVVITAADERLQANLCIIRTDFQYENHATMLRYLFFFLAPLFLAIKCYGQEDQTLLKGARIRGGFGGPTWVFSRAVGDAGWGVGGGGGVIIGSLFIGGFGQGETFGRRVVQGREHQFSLGYGGLWLGVAYPSHRLVHLYGSLKLGVGGVSLLPRQGGGEGFNDSVALITPEVGAEVNITKWFRLVGHVGHRWVAGLDGLGPYANSEDFNSVVWGLTLRFGSF